jgi:hypothetical protein
VTLLRNFPLFFAKNLDFYSIFNEISIWDWDMNLGYKELENLPSVVRGIKQLIDIHHCRANLQKNPPSFYTYR